MIAGKVIAITGASSGIGEAAALRLGAQGAKVVLGAGDANKLEALANRIGAAGGEATYISLDVSKREDLEKLVSLAQERFSRLDVLISNAGVMPIGPLDDLQVDDWVRMVDVNIKGVLYGIAAALPVFRKQGFGHFINTASTAAHKVVPNQAVYAATKAAVLALSDGLRQEVSKQLRVTVITPGYTATNFASHVNNPELKAQLEKSAKTSPCRPDAVASAMCFAIDQPDDIDTGEIIIRSTSQA